MTAAQAASRVADLIKETGTFIDGRWVESDGEVTQARDPATDQPLRAVTTTSQPDVHRAIAAARRQFDGGAWRALSPRDRCRRMLRLVEVMESHREALADLGTLEIGTPRAQSDALHAGAPIAFFEWWAQAALRGPDGGWEQGLGIQRQPVSAMSTLYREPLGVVAAITAYNFPLLISAFKVGGALAAGCSVVLMPSPSALLSGIALIRMIEEADFPPGTVNLVVGGPAVGETLTLSAGVDMVTFTGSVAVGKAVMAQSASTVKKVVLELGGKSPNILLPGASLEEAVRPSILRYCRNAGQACGATTRTFVHRKDYGEFAERARKVTDALVVGDPWDPATEIGPLISRQARDSVHGYLDRALAGRAVQLAGQGRRPDEAGHFVNPALIGNVTNDDEICQNEIFGPVGALIPYDDLDNAIAMANATRYGLNANVWGDPDKAIAVGRRLKAGTVTINGGGGAEYPEAPWPSSGESGVGVDRGMEGFREFFALRHIVCPTS